MVELREETGVQRSLTERLVRSRLQWAGYVERMADDRLPKRAAELREQGRRRRGRPRLCWEDFVKRDVKKTGEEGDWKKKTGDRGGWRRIADEAVKKLQAVPLIKGKRGRERERERLAQQDVPGTKSVDVLVGMPRFASYWNFDPRPSNTVRR